MTDVVTPPVLPNTPEPQAAPVGEGASPTAPPPLTPPLAPPPAAGNMARVLPPALVWVTLAVAVLALAMGMWLWQSLERIQQALAKRAAEVAETVTVARLSAEQAQTLAQALQARLAVAEVKLSEVSLQRTQLEELMLSVSRSRDDTLVLDIESGLRLASQQAELTGSVQPLVSALVAADRRIAKAAQPRLNPVQRAMARDLERIRSTAVTDVPALVQRLDELIRLADDLQLVNAPVRVRSPGADHPVAPRSVKAPAPNGRDATPESPLGGGDLGRGWVQVAAFWHDLWTRTVRSATQSLGDLVRVGRIDRPEAVLLSPDQSFFLRENLKLKVLNARLGLLSRQVPTSRADLGAVRHMLATYFDPQDAVTRQALQVLSDVLQASKTVVMPRPDETLTALAAAASGR